MSKTDTTAKNKNSMATFFKVLRFIGKYRFLLVLSVILAAVTVGFAGRDQFLMGSFSGKLTIVQ